MSSDHDWFRNQITTAMNRVHRRIAKRRARRQARAARRQQSVTANAAPADPEFLDRLARFEQLLIAHEARQQGNR